MIQCHAKKSNYIPLPQLFHRKNLYIELDKIYNYSLSNKNLEYEIVSKLTNLAENYGVSELADQYLCKNVKQITKLRLRKRARVWMPKNNT